MNLPPRAYSSWSELMEHHWRDGSRFQIAVEKLSGEGRDSLGSATQPPTEASSRRFFAEELLCHWLSSFMNKHLPQRRHIAEPLLGIVFSTKEIQKIFGTQYEEQGAVTVAASLDLGQLRDMVQSPLLEVLAVRTRTLKTPIPRCRAPDEARQASTYRVPPTLRAAPCQFLFLDDECGRMPTRT